MSLAKQLSAELKQESVNTKKILERVPNDKLTWQPHEKSMTLGRLAYHIAEIPSWISRAIENDEYDFMTSPQKRIIPEATQQILEEYEKTWPKAIQLLENTTDEFLSTNWKLRRGEMIIADAPRRFFIRNFGLNHLIHHRGQLSVYLRLLDVPVPGMYGPTADER